ncbi:hypothetical protein V2J09_022621, partial [Rumex salicifolius]
GGSEQGVTNAVKQGVNDTLKTGEDLKNKAASTAEHNAWESSKGSAAAAAEVLPSKESVTAVEVDGPRLHSKDAVEIAKLSMNTKKEDNT